MADDQDPASKTEDPTGRKLEQSFEKGDIARSSEIGHLFMLLAGAIALMVLSGDLVRKLHGRLGTFLGGVDRIPADAAGLGGTLLSLLGDVAVALLPMSILFVVFAIGSNMIQNRPGIAWSKIGFQAGRVSPVAGFRRLFSAQAVVEFLKSLAKIAVVAAVGLMMIRPELRDMSLLVSADVAAILPRISDLSLILLWGVIAVMGVIAGADIFYQKFSHLRRLRMTRQEVKEEMKQTEGDPVVKSRLRSLRIERARRRMMAAVPKADVVVTNPTHFAVALKYDAESMAAPRVVAKGADLVAFRIREIAAQHDVPVVENPPLARALYVVDLGQDVPVEHYRAVAEIIGYVMRLKGRFPVRRPA